MSHLKVHVRFHFKKHKKLQKSLEKHAFDVAVDRSLDDEIKGAPLASFKSYIERNQQNCRHPQIRFRNRRSQVFTAMYRKKLIHEYIFY